MGNRNLGLIADVLFVAVTRPPMRWGVAYAALLFNFVFAMEVFLVTKNLLTLLIVIPIHGICMLLCARDARIFDLILLWGRTRMPAYFANYRVWKASSLSPLLLDLPNRAGRRRWPTWVRSRHQELDAMHIRAVPLMTKARAP